MRAWRRGPVAFCVARIILSTMKAAMATLGATMALACGGSATSPQPPAAIDDRLTNLVATIDELRVTARIPGLAMAVVQDREVVVARGFGVTDIRTGAAVTPDTPFNIASVAKPISAVVAMRLVELGTLDLDRPMAGYDGFAALCSELLAEGGLFFADYACADPRLTLRHVMSMQANGTPGTRFYYNPVSYSWASRPMAQVTSTPFSDLVAQHVFGPAGMTHAARIHRKQPLPPALAAIAARPHRVDDSGVTATDEPPPQGDGAAGGVVTSVSDLARFDIALDAGTLLSESSRRAMWTPTKSPDGAPLPYALGWYVQDVEGIPVLWHAGWWEQAYSAIYLKVPSRRATLILLANSEGLHWGNPLDAAAIERSRFATPFVHWLASGGAETASSRP
jgi:CubicO group peptidase (beta-lactamase class C family)